MNNLTYKEQLANAITNQFNFGMYDMNGELNSADLVFYKYFPGLIVNFVHDDDHNYKTIVYKASLFKNKIKKNKLQKIKRIFKVPKSRSTLFRFLTLEVDITTLEKIIFEIL